MSCLQKTFFNGLISTGERILSLEVPKEQIYPMKLKGYAVCFQMLKAILSGNYVNFGVFKLYGDDALDNVLNMTAKLILSIAHDDILVSQTSTGFEHSDLKRALIAGLPQTVPSVLHSDRVPRPGPHHLPVHAGTARVSVHPREYIQGFECVRYVVSTGYCPI